MTPESEYLFKKNHCEKSKNLQFLKTIILAINKGPNEFEL